MGRAEYIAAVNSIIYHDKISTRIRDVSESLAREVGDDFGGLALIPETPMRKAFITVIEQAAMDTDKHTSYLFDEALSMKGGGR